MTPAVGPTKKPESSLGSLNSADSGGRLPSGTYLGPILTPDSGGAAALRDLFGTYLDPMTPAEGPTKKPESSFGSVNSGFEPPKLEFWSLQSP